MRTIKKIGNTHKEEMDLIMKFILNFDVNKLLYAINGKLLREEDIVSLTITIQEYFVKLSRQKVYLFRFGEIFNKEFTHEDNKCFDASLKASRKIRSLSAGIKAIIKPFVKVSRRKLPNGSPVPTIMERSMISTEYYYADLYGLPSYPDCVKDLFRVMLQFYEVVDVCIAECTRILMEEKSTKADKRKCIELFKEACEKSRKNQLHIIEAIENDPSFKEALKKSPYLTSDENNPVLKAFKKSPVSGSFAQKYFHNCTPKDIGKITLYKAWSESNEDPMLMLAHTVFGNDDEKIRRINYVISHFDMLLPPVCKRKVIPAYHLYVFMEWCGIVHGTESFLNYFKKYYLSHGGKWKVVGKTAINGAKNRPYKAKYKDSCKQIKNNMLNSIKSLLSIFDDKEITV